jgi:hypothetical protein
MMRASSSRLAQNDNRRLIQGIRHASKAIQRNEESLDCFIASLLAMTMSNKESPFGDTPP